MILMWYFNLLVRPKIGIIWSFPQNYHQLPEVPLVHPKIGIVWSFYQNYHQLPEVPLVNPKIGIFPKITTSCPRYPWCNLE